MCATQVSISTRLTLPHYPASSFDGTCRRTSSCSMLYDKLAPLLIRTGTGGSICRYLSI